MQMRRAALMVLSSLTLAVGARAQSSDSGSGFISSAAAPSAPAAAGNSSASPSGGGVFNSQSSSPAAPVPGTAIGEPASAQPAPNIPLTSDAANKSPRRPPDNGPFDPGNKSAGKPKEDPGKDNGADKPAPVPPKQKPAYDANGQPYGSRYYPEHPRTVEISLLRRPGLSPDQFVLHLAAAGPTTGCPKISSLPHKVDFSQSGLEVTIEDYTVDMRNLPDAPQYACRPHPVIPAADIVLDRTDLAQRGVTKFTFLTSDNSGGRDSFDVVTTDHRIWLKPSKGGNSNDMMQKVGVAVNESTQQILLTALGSAQAAHYFHAAEISNVQNTLIHWFYPKGTVILTVPNAPRGVDLAEKVETAAAAAGLEPLKDSWPDFVSPLARPDFYYYVDRRGSLADAAGLDSGVAIGVLPVPKVEYGLDADHTVENDLPVYARSPASYE